jgi:glutamyl-tRNA reductase
VPDELDAGLVGEFWGEYHRLPAEQVRPHLYHRRNADAVHHLFRVAASLDSLVVGEGQIAGQVKQAYEVARAHGTVGPFLHGLFQHALKAAKRVRRETAISKGHVSVASVAVEYVRGVFDHFGDKTVLVIGAGKMGGLTLRHLRALSPRAILVTNRSQPKADAVARDCGGTAVPWEKLDEALARADIVLSTTGAPEPIVTRERFERARARRAGGPVVVLDIAVPRDFDPAIHDGDQTWVVNVDDLKHVCAETLRERLRHVPAAEAVAEQETRRFVNDFSRRRHAPVIARLTQDVEAKRQAIVAQLLNRLDGRLAEADRADIEGAFRLFQNQVLHGPISALSEAAHEGGGHTLLEALRKLFRLQE